jgi:hypothetical protein
MTFPLNRTCVPILMDSKGEKSFGKARYFFRAGGVGFWGSGETGQNENNVP